MKSISNKAFAAMYCRWIPLARVTVALLTLSASLPAAEPAKLPEFLGKVQLHNFAGVEPTADGEGVMPYRPPTSVRDRMTETNKQSGKTGADQMLYARQSEIRFVLNSGGKIENVRLHVQSTAAATVTDYWGDILVHGTVTLRPGGSNKPLVPRGHGLLK